jgi:hypothetical protein
MMLGSMYRRTRCDTKPTRGDVAILKSLSRTVSVILGFPVTATILSFIRISPVLSVFLMDCGGLVPGRGRPR